MRAKHMYIVVIDEYFLFGKEEYNTSVFLSIVMNAHVHPHRTKRGCYLTTYGTGLTNG